MQQNLNLTNRKSEKFHQQGRVAPAYCLLYPPWLQWRSCRIPGASGLVDIKPRATLLGYGEYVELTHLAHGSRTNTRHRESQRRATRKRVHDVDSEMEEGSEPAAAASLTKIWNDLRAVLFFSSSGHTHPAHRHRSAATTAVPEDRLALPLEVRSHPHEAPSSHPVSTSAFSRTTT
jgi:hypothetical protein